MPYSYLHSAQYHRLHCTLQAFEQFIALYIVASELKDPICHSSECQIGSFSSVATICTTTMTNFRPGQDSDPVHLSFEPKPDRISHRVRPSPLWRVKQNLKLKLSATDCAHTISCDFFARSYMASINRVDNTLIKISNISAT